MSTREPLLETTRLLLRPPRLEDFEAWAAFRADEEVTRFIGGVEPRSLAWRGFAAMVGMWQLRGVAMFSVIERTTGRWIGRVGPWQPEGWPGTEVGWSLTRDAGTEDDDVWFKFVATSTSQNITLTLPNSLVTASFDFVHQVYSGTCTSLVSKYCSDLNTSTNATYVVGDTYYIRVYSWTATTGQMQNFGVCVSDPLPPPSNDLCSGALPVTVSSVGCEIANVVTSTVIGATGTADPACTGTEDDDVWFSFVATNSTQNISLTLPNSTATATFDFVHQVYSGSCTGLASVYCSDPNTSRPTPWT